MSVVSDERTNLVAALRRMRMDARYDRMLEPFINAHFATLLHIAEYNARHPDNPITRGEAQ